MADRRLGPIVKTLIFTVLVPGCVAFLFPRWILPPGSHVRGGALGITGAISAIAGAAIYLSCAWNFAYHGLGTPAPIDPPKLLVSRGLNRYVRNPMYIGVLAMVLGQAALFRSREVLEYAIFLWIAFTLFILFYEEPALHRQFGSEYDDYRRNVPRWIPRFRSPR